MLGFFPLGFVLLVEGGGGEEDDGGLTSQFWARRDTESVFHAKEVQPSASRPMDISCLKFIARTVRKGRPAPSPIPGIRKLSTKYHEELVNYQPFISSTKSGQSLSSSGKTFSATVEAAAQSILAFRS